MNALDYAILQKVIEGNGNTYASQIARDLGKKIFSVQRKVALLIRRRYILTDRIGFQVFLRFNTKRDKALANFLHVQCPKCQIRFMTGSGKNMVSCPNKDCYSSPVTKKRNKKNQDKQLRTRFLVTDKTMVNETVQEPLLTTLTNTPLPKNAIENNPPIKEDLPNNAIENEVQNTQIDEEETPLTEQELAIKNKDNIFNANPPKSIDPRIAHLVKAVEETEKNGKAWKKQHQPQGEFKGLGIAKPATPNLKAMQETHDQLKEKVSNLQETHSQTVYDKKQIKEKLKKAAPKIFTSPEPLSQKNQSIFEDLTKKKSLSLDYQRKLYGYILSEQLGRQTTIKDFRFILHRIQQYGPIPKEEAIQKMEEEGCHSTKHYIEILIEVGLLQSNGKRITLTNEGQAILNPQVKVIIPKKEIQIKLPA